MSDVLADTLYPTDLEHLDEMTKSIVNGFIYTNTKPKYQRVPNVVNLLALLYIDDHFMMHRGSYQWVISSPQQIQRVLSSQSDYWFNSVAFEMCALPWIMELCPNFDGNLCIHITLLMWPPKWKCILVHQTLTCQETNTAVHSVVEYVGADIC